LALVGVAAPAAFQISKLIDPDMLLEYVTERIVPLNAEGALGGGVLPTPTPIG